VNIPEKTAIQLAQTITVLRPSFVTSTYLDNFVKGTPLYGYGYAFLKAEEISGIGADYLICISIHETGWGKSSNWTQYNNPASWGITDSGWNSEAYKISKMTKEQAIVYWATQLKNLYLTKGGTYYSGETLYAINKYYASDTGWASSILSIHSSLVKTFPEDAQAKEWVMETGILKGDLPSPNYFTSDYWTKQISKNDLAVILFRINKSK
jgi:beta-N-acetylglucosaminidase